jgi:hypothetical protein
MNFGENLLCHSIQNQVFIVLRQKLKYTYSETYFLASCKVFPFIQILELMDGRRNYRKHRYFVDVL